MDFVSLLFYFVIIIPSSIIHEYAHGWVADMLGDPTARYAGRLTIDPRPHIDLWGTLLMPLLLFIATSGRFIFAYAKPVPYNPYNLKDQKWGPVWVGLAGPMANFLLAAAFALVLRLMPYNAISEFLAIIVYANIMLMVFNLVPIPPLDGSKLLYALLPDSAYKVRQFLNQYGFMILLFFVFFMFELIRPIIEGLFKLLVG
ncbi:MAG: site-2 protease family protein [Candidatus Magasanikbacteria bacterium]|nr:site-2 protease family protein [Candidatus Magasanikbacteria bacterium]